jgi:DNA polymerase-3 subunit delta'
MPFAAIIGHAPLVALLRHAVVRGRVPQSLIFGGPDGVGKRTIAIALAQAVNCPQAADGDACGRCVTCARIARGVHSDVAVLDRGDEASIKIGPVRERVLDVIGYRPFEARRRVFIVDDAERLTEQAQDALLKTLEEPPRHAILILVTSTPDVLKPTVQSRCRRLRFGILTAGEVARVLVDRAGFDAAEANVLATASGGSVGRAIAADAGELKQDRQFALALLEGAAGSLGARLKASAALVPGSKAKRSARDAVRARLAAAASFLRDLAALASGVDPAALTNKDRAAELQTLSRAYGLARVDAAFSAIVRAQEALSANANAKIVADWVAVTM